MKDLVIRLSSQNTSQNFQTMIEILFTNTRHEQRDTCNKEVKESLQGQKQAVHVNEEGKSLVW